MPAIASAAVPAFLIATAITDAYAFLKLGYLARPTNDFRVVVNMAKSHAQGERTYATLRKACETFLGKTPRLGGVIRRDEKVRDAIRHQTPLLTRHPNSRAAASCKSPDGLRLMVVAAPGRGLGPKASRPSSGETSEARRRNAHAGA